VITERFKRFLFALEDRLFDWRNGVDTRGVIAPADTEGADREAALHATSYQAVWTRNLRVLVRAAMRAGRPAVFVDVGAGKGKACIYASRHFSRVIGVEYSSALVAAARANQGRAGRSNIEYVLADASQYDLPNETSLVFLFNPFDHVIMSRFLGRNRARIKAHGSLIAYANDVQRDTLADSGFECLFRDPVRNISLWR
jgi:precorrin-6B methylase 2